MIWHPRLVVRTGANKSLSSFTSNRGHLFLAFCGAFLTALISWYALKEPRLWVSLTIPGAVFWDVWAWFAASEAEKAAFREEVARLTSQGYVTAEEQLTWGRSWGPTVLWVSLAVAVGSALLVTQFFNGTLLGVIFLSWSLFLVALLDQVRARFRARLRKG